ncbi:hypothetical protein KAFR_0D03250 [Kazachstania africana CBS 2517]|uniref:Splicing factor YJU2 n=1 Tax=Kazachstania africana (strain ATCC 22294 / BCRC 22015 / CBS 2517 / CECT 1963 / NBRC 1671 / NRRL Y-8276) TaxID=1071382 RepID=H2AUC3_KAZAF|nr:hypothetical protein KAFR_0D03250 [Kazachstania africana CBS 2517]CCF57973.1 hypothetical protein KAFR_0D03250 [Kazachstania africana CBS 2517]
MSERKALNKYYPPDYDPIAAEKAARKMSKSLKNIKKDSVTIRLMTPFSMTCSVCSEFISKSRKFNGKKELLPNKYLEKIKVYKFTIRCPRCTNSISFRTDPKSADYVMESGGIRSYVKRKEEEFKSKEESVDETLERLAKRNEEEEENTSEKNTGDDKMEVLEQRLAKLQKTQEDEAEIENLRKANYQRMQRASDMLQDTDNRLDTDSDELDIISRNAFKNFANSNFNAPANIASSSTKAQDSGKIDVKELVQRRNKIKLKKHGTNKKNALGIVGKKR